MEIADRAGGEAIELDQKVLVPIVVKRDHFTCHCLSLEERSGVVDFEFHCIMFFYNKYATNQRPFPVTKVTIESNKGYNS